MPVCSHRVADFFFTWVCPLIGIALLASFVFTLVNIVYVNRHHETYTCVVVSVWTYSCGYSDTCLEFNVTATMCNQTVSAIMGSIPSMDNPTKNVTELYPVGTLLQCVGVPSECRLVYLLGDSIAPILVYVSGLVAVMFVGVCMCLCSLWRRLRMDRESYQPL